MLEIKKRRKQGLSRRRFLTLSVGSAGALAAADTFWYEPQAVQIETLRLTTGQPGKTIRMVQISDLHLSEFSAYFQKVAERVAALQPDLIVLTGDYLEEQRNIRGVLDFMRLLKAPHGVYAVQGNWEYWSRLEGENLRRHCAGVDVQLLIDERRDLEINGQAWSILGLDYPSSGGQLQRLQKDIDPRRFNLLLSHVPAFAHEELSEHTGLILCGHTHGGQVRLPYCPPFYLPLYSGRFVAGSYQVGRYQLPLYVNRGIGTSVLPMRLLCRPEITLIELTGAASKG